MDIYITMSHGNCLKIRSSYFDGNVFIQFLSKLNSFKTHFAVLVSFPFIPMCSYIKSAALAFYLSELSDYNILSLLFHAMSYVIQKQNQGWYRVDVTLYGSTLHFPRLLSVTAAAQNHPLMFCK